MKISNYGKFIGQALIGTLIGWLVGLGISWVNVFGSSGQAPIICAIVCGALTIGRLIRQQKEIS